ncbi:MAG: transcriptional regulator NrdR [Clostridiales bacterium]|nr:MAG: transcriptional regulator NrdR [Clostridiales bacterium]
MLCPVCHHDSKVVETRLNDNGTTIRRRRECTYCGKRFTTYEKIEDMPLIVLKKDGRKELFDGSKILKGLVKACEKRPISLEQLEEFVDEVERDLKNNYTEVHSEVIGQTVMDKLIALDEVSYVRFASVYKHFDDVQTFIHEIEQMEGKGDGK